MEEDRPKKLLDQVRVCQRYRREPSRFPVIQTKLATNTNADHLPGITQNRDRRSPSYVLLLLNRDSNQRGMRDGFVRRTEQWETHVVPRTKRRSWHRYTLLAQLDE